MISALFLLHAFSPQPGDDPGPSNLAGTVHGHQVVAEVSHRVEQTVVSQIAGQFSRWTDGPLADIRADAWPHPQRERATAGR